MADIDDESLERVFGSMAADRVSSLVVKRDRRLLLKLRTLAAHGPPMGGNKPLSNRPATDACGA